MKYNTLTDFYTEGYNCGYNWLNPDKPYANNFKHPSTKISGSVYYVLLDYLEDTYKYFAYELERV